MSKRVEALLEHLSLEKIEENLYRGQSKDLGWGRVYGGQVLAQGIGAAAETLPADRRIHSMHAYFLLGGDTKVPVLYDVNRSRDGGSFNTRFVQAIQHGRPILTMSASFQRVEPGFEHQDEMPDVPAPEDVERDEDRHRRLLASMPHIKASDVYIETPFEIRTIDDIDHPVHPTPKPPQRMYWIRASSPLPDDFHTHAKALAYFSDHSFLTTALQPHGVAFMTPGMQLASIDHSMWFHSEFRIDDWLLYVIESPAAAGARALVRGRVFTRDGRLVVTTAQEGLIRRSERKAR